MAKRSRTTKHSTTTKRTRPPPQRTPPRALYSPFTSKRLRERFIRSMALAYSRRFNPRRLEFAFYAPWMKLIEALVSGTLLDKCDEIEICPQHVITRTRNHGQEHQDISISAATRTAKRGNFDDLVPDFGVLCFTPALRKCPSLKADSDNWSHISIKKATVRGFFELKRPVSRSVTIAEDFYSLLNEGLVLAMKAADAQAALYFNSHPQDCPDHILLVGIVGDWFTFKVARRVKYPLPEETPHGWPKVFARAINLQGGRSRQELPSPPAVSTLSVQSEASDGEDSDDDAGADDAEPIPSFGDNDSHSNSVVQDLRDAWPPRNEWSARLKLGTAAANQRLWLISQYLRGFIEDGAPI